MPKNKIKEVFTEYWNLIIEGIFSTIIIGAFMPINFFTFIFGLIFIMADMSILIYSLVYSNDPKFLISYLITEYLMKN